VFVGASAQGNFTVSWAAPGTPGGGEKGAKAGRLEDCEDISEGYQSEAAVDSVHCCPDLAVCGEGTSEASSYLAVCGEGNNDRQSLLSAQKQFYSQSRSTVRVCSEESRRE
jgi:hypothetical protein